MMTRLALAALPLTFSVLAKAQISFEPAFFGQDETVTLFYDATAGTGGLADCTCDVYLHTGLITPESTDGGDWQFVRTVWATTNPDHKMTPVDGRPNVYSFELDIPGFYRFTDGTVVEQLAFVFRDGDGSREGKADGGADIYYDVQAAGAAFSTRVDAPTGEQNLYEVGSAFTLRVAASEDVASFSISDNGLQVAEVTGTNTLEREIAVESGNHLLRVLARSADGDTSSVRIRYVGLAQMAAVTVPVGIEPGHTELEDGRSAFYLYAPGKQRALLRFDTEDFGLDASNQLAPVSDGTGFYLETATPGGR